MSNENFLSLEPVEKRARVDDSLENQFLNACKEGKLNDAKKCVEKGADYGQCPTALSLACVSANVELVRYLCDELNFQPCIKNPDGNSALFLACQLGNKNIISCLLWYVDDMSEMERVLELVVLSQNKNIAGLFAEHFSQWLIGNAPLSILEFIYKAQKDERYWINSEHVSNVFLSQIFEFGSLECVKFFIERFSLDVNQHKSYHGKSWFQVACSNKDLSLVRYLYEEKNADLWLISTPHGSYEKSNAFLIACRNGNLTLVKYFCEELNINPANTYDDINTTALFEAARGGHLELVRYLIEERGAPVFLSYQYGQNAFFHACKGNDENDEPVVNLELVKYLRGKMARELGERPELAKHALHAACHSAALEVAMYIYQELKPEFDPLEEYTDG